MNIVLLAGAAATFAAGLSGGAGSLPLRHAGWLVRRIAVRATARPLHPWRSRILHHRPSLNRPGSTACATGHDSGSRGAYR